MSNYINLFSLIFTLLISHIAHATVEFNSSGGTSSSNGLRVYIGENSQIQIKRSGSGQVYSASKTPISSQLDNGVYIRADGAIYGPTHNWFTPSGGNYSSYTISATTPANPASNGTEQTATSSLSVSSSGPQVSVVWKYTTPLDYITAEVTITIPSSYSVSSSNPVRYYHAFDTYLSGSDNGCNFSHTDSNGKLLVGTYKPTGSSCSSSTSIPSGVTVVEAFRERTGSFSNYCSSNWNSFWTSDSNGCYLAQSSSLGNKVNTNYQDTGIGIQYTFTSAGTYTFSYDFVVGSTTVSSNSLKAYYKMDETSWSGASNEVTDSSGNGYHATLAYRSGSALPSTANSNRAISGTTGTCGYGVFSSEQYVSLPSSFPSQAGSFAITAWFNSQNASQTNQRIVSDDANNNSGYALTLNDNGIVGRLKFLQRSPSFSVNFSYSFQSNTWYFVAVTVNTLTSTVKLYLYDQSGNLLNSITGSNNSSASDSGLTTIGSEPSGSSESYGFNGFIDEVRLYSGELTDAEIAALSHATHSCPTYVSNVNANSFNCISEQETSVSSGRLYTQMAGNSFGIKVIALNSSNTAETSFSTASARNVTLSFVDQTTSSAITFNDGSSDVSSKALTFPASDTTGILSVSSLTISNAYKNLKCQIYDSTASVTASSSDSFSVRPYQLVLAASGAGADSSGSSTSATPIIKTGTSFSVTATGVNASGTTLTGYTGTPIVTASSITAHSGATNTGTLSGSFSAATSGVATSSFTYSEVGYFKLNAGAVTDTSFTSTVDSYSGGDCTNDFSVTAVSGKYGCNIQNISASSYWGRFIPDHFAITTGTNTEGCDSGNFTYFGQDGLTTVFTLTAQNASNTTTQNYTGSFAKLGLTTWSNYAFSAATLPTGSSISASGSTPSGSWSNGAASVSAKHKISRPTSATAPTNITIYASPVDSDGVTVSSATAVSAATPFRYGRLWMSNTYGSELLNLTVPIETQYWSSTGVYQRNQLDSCTAIAPANFAMANYKGNLAACETVISGGGTMASGKTTMTLSKPGNGNNGSVDLSLNLNSAAGSTCTSSTASSATNANLPQFGTSNPTARETFGLFKSPVIYMRENY